MNLRYNAPSLCPCRSLFRVSSYLITSLVPSGFSSVCTSPTFHGLARYPCRAGQSNLRSGCCMYFRQNPGAVALQLYPMQQQQFQQPQHQLRLQQQQQHQLQHSPQHYQQQHRLPPHHNWWLGGGGLSASSAPSTYRSASRRGSFGLPNENHAYHQRMENQQQHHLLQPTPKPPSHEPLALPTTAAARQGLQTTAQSGGRLPRAHDFSCLPLEHTISSTGVAAGGGEVEIVSAPSSTPPCSSLSPSSYPPPSSSTVEAFGARAEALATSQFASNPQIEMVYSSGSRSGGDGVRPPLPSTADFKDRGMGNGEGGPALSRSGVGIENIIGNSDDADCFHRDGIIGERIAANVSGSIGGSGDKPMEHNSVAQQQHHHHHHHQTQEQQRAPIYTTPPQTTKAVYSEVGVGVSGDHDNTAMPPAPMGATGTCAPLPVQAFLLLNPVRATETKISQLPRGVPQHAEKALLIDP